ncbi:hypothetical protein [Streptomyces sp. 135]|uniref:hypothetical protein n=1 Tax=Streptomyces sp. 135 TaxID=2838850 RepID=UPI001CBC0B3F|nr:hypothetical protein [Streptomyces sp. 135]
MIKDGGRVVQWTDGKERTLPQETRSGVDAVADALDYTLGLKDGRVIEWNIGNKPVMQPVPEEVQSGVTTIWALNSDRYAVKDGTLLTWGDDGKVTPVDGAPKDLVALTNPYMGLTRHGEVVMWGPYKKYAAEIPEEARSGVMKFAAAEAETVDPTDPYTPVYGVALKKNGDLITWGTLDDSSGMNRPKPDNVDHHIRDIAANGNSIAAVTEEGAVTVWGDPGFVWAGGDAPTSGITQVCFGNGFFLALKGGPGPHDPTDDDTPTPAPDPTQTTTPAPDPTQTTTPAPSPTSSGSGSSGGGDGGGDSSSSGSGHMQNAGDARPSGSMAHTGTGMTWPLAGAGALLIAAGTVVALAARRRRHP